MDVSAEIASLRAEVAQIKRSTPPPQQDRSAGIVAQLQRDLAVVTAQLAALQQWKNSLQGQNGIEVTGNVIRLTTPKDLRAHSEVTQTGCLNGQPGAAMNDAFTVRPYQL